MIVFWVLSGLAYGWVLYFLDIGKSFLVSIIRMVPIGLFFMALYQVNSIYILSAWMISLSIGIYLCFRQSSLQRNS